MTNVSKHYVGLCVGVLVAALLGSAGTNLSGLSVNPLSTFVDSRTVGLLAGGGTTFSTNSTDLYTP